MLFRDYCHWSCCEHFFLAKFSYSQKYFLTCNPLHYNEKLRVPCKSRVNKLVVCWVSLQLMSRMFWQNWRHCFPWLFLFVIHTTKWYSVLDSSGKQTQKDTNKYVKIHKSEAEQNSWADKSNRLMTLNMKKVCYLLTDHLSMVSKHIFKTLQGILKIL